MTTRCQDCGRSVATDDGRRPTDDGVVCSKCWLERHGGFYAIADVDARVQCYQCADNLAGKRVLVLVDVVFCDRVCWRNHESDVIAGVER